MIRFFLLSIVCGVISFPAYALYTTKDNNTQDCVPVEATTAPDVRYDTEADQWSDVNATQAGVQTQDGGNIAMNLRVPPSRINNRAFQKHLGSTEVHVGTYYKSGAEENLSILGQDIPTGSTRYCK